MAKDIYHDDVRIALEKEGWIITHDPFVLRFEGITYNIDLGAEEVLGAEKDGQKIAIEIKSFVGISFVNKFHEAIGQFLNYAVGLEEKEPERLLYMAVPESTFEKFFQFPVIKKTMERYSIRIIIYNPKQQIIVKWIS